MVFSSLLFLFAFLAPQLLIYFLVRKNTARNIVLLIFSLIFYSWGGPRYLILLVGESLVSWFIAKEIGNSQFDTMKKRWLLMECLIMFGLLVVFKYLGFVCKNIQLLTGWPRIVPEIALPIGISFYTFQLVSYVVDVYRGEVKAQPRYWKVLLYASLFHQCIAGPIVRYQTVEDEIDNRKVTSADVAAGIRRFSIGLAKKAVLANGCANLADTLVPEELSKITGASTAGLWLGMFFYMLQIYLDFSAYSDMAIGMGRMVGFHYLENFNYPYIARSVQDFWRRWHISLSTFFRDYVYIPLGGNRKGTFRTFVNMFAVWFLTGMWHGASWNFILWGLFFFVFLVIERLFLGKLLDKNRFTHTIGHVYTLIVVYFGWVLFRFTDTATLMEVLRGMFGKGHDLTSIEIGSTLKNNMFFIAAAVLSVVPLGKKLRSSIYGRARKTESLGVLNVMYCMDALTPFVLIILAVLALVGNSYNPFLYFRF